MSDTTSSPSLLDPAFLARLERLRLLVRRALAGTGAGARRTRRHGASIEFADHRPYVPGDDPRRIDWNAYARLEELVLKLFHAEEDLTLHLLVDTSASMSTGSPPKLWSAKRMAAALGYLALGGGDRVAVQPFAAGLGRPMQATRGKARVARLLSHLDALEPAGGTSLADTIDAFLLRQRRPGLVAIVSDLFDPAGFERSLDRLGAAGHERAVFHVLSREDLDPGAHLEGDLELLDAESPTGPGVNLTVDARALRAYERQLGRFLGAIEGYVKKQGMAYVRVEGDAAVEDALFAYVRGASGAPRRGAAQVSGR